MSATIAAIALMSRGGGTSGAPNAIATTYMAVDIMVKRVLSLGAGVQSTVMALLSARGDLPPVDAAIFADTQSEPAGVYKHLDWLESQLPFPVYRVTAGSLRDDIMASINGARVASAPFHTGAKLTGSEHFAPVPFRNAVDGGMLRRQCTREYKVTPIYLKIRELAGLKKGQRYPKDTPPIEQWIGISTDEAQRMKPAQQKWINNVWPLIDLDMSRQKCIEWFALHYPGHVLEKSACTFCPYHNDALWRDMKMNDPTSFADAVAVDDAIRAGIRGVETELYIHRSLKPLSEVDFRNLEDEGQINLFGNECEGMCGV